MKLDKFDCVSFVSEFDTQLLDILPHGSGINYDYKIRVGGAPAVRVQRL